MDLQQHLKQVGMLTEIFCMMPTMENLNLLRNSVRQMEFTCEELITEHPDYKG